MASFTESTEIPQILLDGPCCLGIDEAGRGPVLGPMTYAAAYCPLGRMSELREMGIDDSKKITIASREDMLHQKMTIDCKAWLAWSVTVLSPRDISRAMLRKEKYNLNALSIDTAIALIRDALKRGIKVVEVYVDTVGSPEKYQKNLTELFPSIKCIVAKGADHTYAIVSAASIAAKVKRDALLKNWVFSELGMQEAISREFGSGYPGDPNTKRWLRENIDPCFGYPELIRFSWSTCARLLEDEAINVLWPDYEEDDANRGGAFAKQGVKRQASLMSYVKTNEADVQKEARSCSFFRKMSAVNVTDF